MLELNEINRRVVDLQAGQMVDYWSDDEMVWKWGTVTEVTKSGRVSIAPKKGTDEVVLQSSSRKLAPVHCFTKEERPASMQEVRVAPLQLMPRSNFEPVAGEQQQQRIFGMPMFLGYYWGQNEVGNAERNRAFDGVDPFNF